MDKRFIKKNIVLFIVIGVSILVVIFQAVIIIMEHAEMQKYINETKDMVAKIDNLNSQRPAPVPGNDALIKADIDEYKVKVKDMLKYFGQPYYDAKMAFVKELLNGLKNDQGEEVSDDEKLERFKQAINAFWEADQLKTARDQIYISFKLKSKTLLGVGFDDYEKRWDDALKKFEEEAKKHTYEGMSDNLYEIFLGAFGFKRTLSLQMEKYNKFADETRIRLIEYCMKQKEMSFHSTKELATIGRGGNNQKAITVGSTFGFPQDEKIAREMIPDYVFVWGIVEDLVHRVADSGVKRLSEFHKNNLVPTQEGNYRYYRFQFTVEGNMESQRQLMANLYKAFDDRRVYIVHDIELELNKDELNEVLRADEQPLIVGTGEIETEMPGIRPPAAGNRPQGNRPQGNRNPRDPGSPQAELSQEERDAIRQAQEAAEDAKKPYNQKRNYGKVLIGDDAVLVSAKFTVDYVIYTTEELK